jgi:hypothetical protein
MGLLPESPWQRRVWYAGGAILALFLVWFFQGHLNLTWSSASGPGRQALPLSVENLTQTFHLAWPDLFTIAWPVRSDEAPNRLSGRVLLRTPAGESVFLEIEQVLSRPGEGALVLEPPQLTEFGPGTYELTLALASERPAALPLVDKEHHMGGRLTRDGQILEAILPLDFTFRPTPYRHLSAATARILGQQHWPFNALGFYLLIVGTYVVCFVLFARKVAQMYVDWRRK